MPERELPARPNLEQYKKQAKNLVKDRADAVPEAVARIRHFHPGFRDLPEFAVQRASFKLSDAQLIIAREHAFESWPKFARYVAKLQRESVPLAGEEIHPSSFTERLRIDGIELTAETVLPEGAWGLVLFAHASGSGRYSPTNRFVAGVLNRGALGTIQINLLTEEEELGDIESQELQLDLRLLGRRIAAITDWIGGHRTLKGLGLGYLASGVGAAAALYAAGTRAGVVKAIVSHGGRPDLAGPWLAGVHAPVLLIVGEKDTVALGFSQSAMAPFPQRTDRKLAIIRGASRLFEEPGALEKSADLASDWFRRYLAVSL
jgi:putative phosphoribosyl transferase